MPHERLSADETPIHDRPACYLRSWRIEQRDFIRVAPAIAEEEQLFWQFHAKSTAQPQTPNYPLRPSERSLPSIGLNRMFLCLSAVRRSALRDCAPVVSAQQRIRELARFTRQSAEESECYHLPSDLDVYRA